MIDKERNPINPLGKNDGYKGKHREIACPNSNCRFKLFSVEDAHCPRCRRKLPEMEETV